MRRTKECGPVHSHGHHHDGHGTWQACTSDIISSTKKRQLTNSSMFAAIRRALLQPASSDSVAAPAGTTVLLSFHGIGTQNYTGRE